MLYLAEVQKRGGLLGQSKSGELRLLACQRSEDRWQSLGSEQIIPVDRVAEYNHGALVLVDLSANNQVQRIQEASRPIVSILQSYSRLQDKVKSQEEEVEQWKQSLTFQTQELARREMEMESRLEQMQHVDEEMVQLDQQRQEAMTLREEAQRMRAELDSKNQELEAAWAQLRGEMAVLESQQSQSQEGAGLSDEQVRGLEEALNQLASAVNSGDELQGTVVQLGETCGAQQGLLDQHWQQLEACRGQIQALQSGLEGQGQAVRDRWQTWHDRQRELDRLESGLEGQRRELQARREHLAFRQTQLKANELLRQQLTQLGGGVAPEVARQVDYDGLDRMPIDELDGKIQALQQDYERVYAFVNDQEEELRLNQADLEALKEQMNSVGEYERMQLEAELADARDTYRILDESLIDQRRTLHEKSAVLKEHKKIQARRRGQVLAEEGSMTVDVSPLLAQLANEIEKQGKQIQELEAEMGQLEVAVGEAEANLQPQRAAHDGEHESLVQADEAFREQQRQEAAMQKQIEVYQGVLQPIQDVLGGLRQQVAGLQGSLEQVQQTRGYQLQQIEGMRQTLLSLRG